eukprot:GFUD01139881.1.p1 GENE.GFUD01139881.1~~GFUD01139881.1.p1  ORF type:complete len:117 (-),score=29.01 GFUD01139881.1:26-376(-)
MLHLLLPPFSVTNSVHSATKPCTTSHTYWILTPPITTVLVKMTPSSFLLTVKADTTRLLTPSFTAVSIPSTFVPLQLAPGPGGEAHGGGEHKNGQHQEGGDEGHGCNSVTVCRHGL